MKKTTSTILAAAVSGLFLGTVTTSCKSHDHNMAQTMAEKHACKTMNSCAGKGGCQSGDHGCAGKNSCKGKGGCATVEKHSCKGGNSCKGQGGCKSGDNGCGGKNSCSGKGGCAVPIKH